MDYQIIANRLPFTVSRFPADSACERAAGRGRRGRCPLQDRDARDRHTRDRYLRETVVQERELGTDLRRLHCQIALLERLSSLALEA